MLFWIFVILLVVGIIMGAFCDCEWQDIGICVFLTGLVGMLVCVIFIIGNNVGIDGTVSKLNSRYESLVYQYENDMYDNDNDLGKKELMNEIRVWNEDLAWYQKNQDDFWLGIFIPNIYDQFKFIELK